MSRSPRLGVDIGAASLKIAELAPQGGRWKLLTAASMPSPEGGVGAATQVSSALVKIIKEAGVKSRRAVAALAEEHISSHIVEMPLLTDSEVEQALQWQVEQYIPLPADQAVWSYQVIKKDQVTGGMEVLLVAAAKTLVENYRRMLEGAGLEVVALETELVATARAVIPPSSPLAVIVDIGSRSTDMGVVRQAQLVFARTVPTAGEAFTRAIETTLGLDPHLAEQYKNTYGFSSQHLEGKLLAAMEPVLVLIAQEVRKTIDFYLSKHPGETVKQLVLSGGVAALPEVVGMLSSRAGLEVVVADPFGQVELDASQKQALAGNGPFYAVAVGAGMREI